MMCRSFCPESATRGCLPLEEGAVKGVHSCFLYLQVAPVVPVGEQWGHCRVLLSTHVVKSQATEKTLIFRMDELAPVEITVSVPCIPRMLLKELPSTTKWVGQRRRGGEWDPCIKWRWAERGEAGVSLKLIGKRQKKGNWAELENTLPRGTWVSVCFLPFGSWRAFPPRFLFSRKEVDQNGNPLRFLLTSTLLWAVDSVQAPCSQGLQI